MLVKKTTAVIMSLILIMGMAACGSNEFNLDEELETAAKWVIEAYPSPGVGSIGGDWAVKGVASSGIESENLDEYFQLYYDDVRAKVKQSEGLLDQFYYTTNARVAIGVEAIGKDATDVEGYNLIEALDAYDKLTEQGVNAAAYALVGANVAGVQLENEERYIEFILNHLEEKKLYEKTDKSDFVAMAMEGLSFYIDRDEVKTMIEKCIEGLAAAQQSDGSFGNCESTAEVIMALTCVGVDPAADERFVKGENTLVDGLMGYKAKDGYLHTADAEEANDMATEKALLALTSMKLMEQGSTLY